MILRSLQLNVQKTQRDPRGFLQVRLHRSTVGTRDFNWNGMLSLSGRGGNKAFSNPG